MALGINSLWKARLHWHSVGVVPALSAIPRELLRRGSPTPSPLSRNTFPFRIRPPTRRLYSSSSSSPSSAPRAPASPQLQPKPSIQDRPAANPPPDHPQPSPGDILLASLAATPLRAHDAHASALVAPARTYAHSAAETRRSARRHHAAAAAQAGHEAVRRAKGRPLPDWRAVLADLTAWTPQGGRAGREEGADGEGEGGRAVLVGKADCEGRAVVTAAEGVLRVVDGAVEMSDAGNVDYLAVGEEEHGEDHNDVGDAATTAIQAPRHGLDLEEGSSMSRPYRRYVLSRNARDIPKPEEWSKESFEGYIAALVNGQVAPHLHARLYPAATSLSHQMTVIDLLHRAFKEEAAHSARSVSAFNMALAYMARNGPATRPDVQALFVRMEMAGLAMNVQTFNILLQSTVKVKDLRNFHATLRLMRGYGQSPTLTTWLLFLQLFEAEEVKRHVLRAMHARGLLNSRAAVRAVAEDLVALDADRAVHHGHSLPAFLASQDARYGPGWMTRFAANRILEVLGRHGRLADCHALLTQHMPHADGGGGGGGPDIVSFNTALTHAKLQRNVAAAIAIARTLDQTHPPVRPNALTYHLLAEAARARRLPLVADVVWHYAALARATTWRMRRRASHRIRLALPRDPTVVRLFPRAAAQQQSQHQAGAATDEPRPDGPPRRPSRTYLGGAAAAQLAGRFEGWEPAVPLGAMMQEAMARDHRLRLQGKKNKEGEKARIPEGEGGGELRGEGLGDGVVAPDEEEGEVEEAFDIPMRRKPQALVRRFQDGSRGGVRVRTIPQSKGSFRGPKAV